MAYTTIIIVALFVFSLIIVLLLFIQARAVKSKKRILSTVVSKNTATNQPADSTTPGHASSAEYVSQQWFLDKPGSGGLTDGRATPTPGRIHLVSGPIQEAPPAYNFAQSYPGLAAYPRSQQEFSSPPPLPTPNFTHAQRRYELEQEYERGMRTIYDEKVGVINFIGMHVIMNTPDEVEIAFHVCKRQIRAVLKSKGLEHAPL